MSDNALAILDHQAVTMRSQLEMVLPDHLPVDRLYRTVRSAVRTTPALIKANRNSLWRAVMSAALFGLEVDGRQSAIIPFKGQAQWIPMVNGLVTIAWNSGFVVQGEVVRAKDDFAISLGVERHLHHVPAIGVQHDRDNPVVGAYAIAHSRTMPPVFEYMDLPDLLRVRDGSKGYQYAKANNKPSQWISDFRGMARKTPVRALCNHLPWNVQRAVEVEDEHDKGRASWATRGEDGAIEVSYADVDEAPPPNTRPANRELDGQGDLIDEDAYSDQMRSQGEAVQAEGKI